MSNSAQCVHISEDNMPKVKLGGGLCSLGYLKFRLIFYPSQNQFPFSCIFIRRTRTFIPYVIFAYKKNKYRREGKGRRCCMGDRIALHPILQIVLVQNNQRRPSPSLMYLSFSSMHVSLSYLRSSRTVGPPPLA